MELRAATRLRASVPLGKNIDGQACVQAIGRTKFNAMTVHAWYTRYCYAPTVHATVFKLNTGLRDEIQVSASYDGRTMVRFEFYKGRVSNAHLFHSDGSTTLDGKKNWKWVQSFVKDESDD